MSIRRARLGLLWSLSAALACTEQRFELISAPPATAEDAGFDGGTDAGAEPCEDLTLDLERFVRTALVMTPRGPIAFGIVSGGTLRSYVVRNGAAVGQTLSTNVSESGFGAAYGREGVALGLHQGGIPSVAMVGSDGEILKAPRSILSVREGANQPWGLRVSVDSQRYLVAYRTLSAEAAFTAFDSYDGGLVFGVQRTTALQEVDSVLVGENVKLLFESQGQVHERLSTLDGGELGARVVSATPLSGRPVACPAVSLYARPDDGGVTVEATTTGSPFVVALNASQLVKGVCDTGSTLALVTAGRSVSARRVFIDGTVVERASVEVPSLFDAALERDDVSVWLLTAPRFETAKLMRRCVLNP